jgi:hypothetical protein
MKFLVLTLILVMMHQVPSVVGSLNGDWVNELGSNVTLKLADGFVTGTYRTSVVSNPNRNELPPSTPLFGTYQETSDGILLTFNVQWKYNNKENVIQHSATTWIGKYYSSEPNKFCTTWILLSDNEKFREWSNFHINKDVFNRM